MEYCFHFVTREEVIRILKERQLQIPNIDHLPDEELTRIYTTFALPLGKREAKTRISSNNWANETEEEKLLRATKRQFMLDVNLADLDLNEKRIKLSAPGEINIILRNRMSEDFDCCHSTKGRKIITGP